MINMYEVMKSIHNFFIIPDAQKEGHYKIEDGQLNLPFLKEAQYYFIEGSLFNDYKVHLYDDDYEGLTDEEFDGFVIPLAVPDDFVSVCTKISTYMTSEKNSPFVGESFGGYSYTKGKHADGTLMGWADAFRQELNVWRKM